MAKYSLALVYSAEVFIDDCNTITLCFASPVVIVSLLKIDHCLCIVVNIDKQS